MNEYPRWAQLQSPTGLVLVAHEAPFINLREVGHGLHVGAGAAVTVRKDWSLVIDFDGLSLDEDNRAAYPASAHVEVLRFTDGRSFPPGNLDRALALFNEHRTHGPVLFHCAAGMSRSPAAAYAILRVAFQLDHEEALRRVRAPNGEGYPLQRTLDSARAWAEASHG